MKKLLCALVFLAVRAWAGPCTPAQYDMMDWFVMSSTLSQQYHLMGTTNPQYTYRVDGGFYHIKGASGYPWDVNYFDNNYVYQWATEYNWGDPTSYKAFNSTTTMPWAPRCVDKPDAGVTGTKLATITLPSTPYTIYGGNCTAQSSNNLGHVINEIWGPTYLSLGGDLPNNEMTLTLSYRYSCDSNYNSCKYKESFDFQRPYGQVRWTYYTLKNGTYVQQSQSVFNKQVSGKSPTPVHPCWK